ncbi:MAG: hypothetical protein AB7O67_16535 [Vicinamibacterales bacterium]
MADVSPFCSFHSKDLPVPGLEPHTVTIRKLGWRALEKAQRAKLSDVASIAREVGDFMNQAADAAAKKKAAEGKDADALEPEKTPEQRRAERRARYDELALLYAAVTGWTFKHPQTGEPVAVGTSTLEDLPAGLKTWLVDEILEYAEPEAEADRKNG